MSIATTEHSQGIVGEGIGASEGANLDRLGQFGAQLVRGPPRYATPSLEIGQVAWPAPAIKEPACLGRPIALAGP